ncbi:hypothetical protein QAD02_021078 [Eretmocerus hayati]|uniref:Uncharacterized protein n=1 Tax=Eretmocerus hayati TaxID=131215 RepID=A0ACC2PNV0_9HYME|nr:hypothetical protein QAD02_021078 [Eretmocerus hayati]
MPNLNRMGDPEINNLEVFGGGLNVLTTVERRTILYEVAYQYNTYVDVAHRDQFEQWCMAMEIAGRINDMKDILKIRSCVSGRMVIGIIRMFLNRNFMPQA